MSTLAHQLLAFVDDLTHGYCEALSISLHIKTRLPIYAIYDPTARVCRWGVDYFHFFLRVEEDKYLNARGLCTGKEMIEFWAEAWSNPSLIDKCVIVPQMPTLYDWSKTHSSNYTPGTGGPIPAFISEAAINEVFVNGYADLLISLHLPE